MYKHQSLFNLSVSIAHHKHSKTDIRDFRARLQLNSLTNHLIKIYKTDRPWNISYPISAFPVTRNIKIQSAGKVF